MPSLIPLIPAGRDTAGGGVTDTAGRRLVYNKEQILNPSFLAFGDPRHDWLALLEGRGA